MRYYLLPRYEDGLIPDYTQLAAQERQRQWNIAKQYMQNPSLPNILNAMSAVWSALPFNTTATTVNPNVQYGEAPNAGGPIKSLSTFEKLSAAGKIQNTKSLITRQAKAEARRAAERRSMQEQWERAGNNAATVINPNKNYTYNEAERAAAIDFLKENPGMKGSVDTNVIDKYSDNYYMYPWNSRFAKLLPTRKSLKDTRLELDRILRSIR